jgi:hypothetical protein
MRNTKVDLKFKAVPLILEALERKDGKERI